MALLKEIQEIIDLPDPRAEADRKLVGTICLVNGVPLSIGKFDWLSQQVTGTTMRGTNKTVERVDSFKVFLPESGIYQLKPGVAVLIIKQPKRQWLKSYSGDFYKAVWVGDSRAYTGWFDDLCKNVQTRTDIFLGKDKKIYYWETPIGYVKAEKDKTTFVCEDLNFKQEIIDWSKNGSLIAV